MEMVSVQYGHPGLIRSALHIHLDAHNCLEAIMIEGKISEIRKLADSLIFLKGVKHGKLVTTGKEVCDFLKDEGHCPASSRHKAKAHRVLFEEF